MKKKNILVTPYLDPEIVQTIYSSLGIPMQEDTANKNDGIYEDIKEDFWLYLISFFNWFA